MKIGIITSSYPNQSTAAIDGAPFLPHTIRALQKAGHQVFVIAPRYEAGPFPAGLAPTFEFQINLNGHRLVDMASFSFKSLPFYLRFFISGIKATRRAISQERPDHILACWAIPSGILALFGCLFKRTRFSTWSLGSDIWKFQKSFLGRRLLVFVLTKAHRIFADGIGLSNIVSKISGKPCEFLPTTRVVGFSNKYSLTLDREKIHFLFVGRLDNDKGPDILLQAFKAAVKANPRLMLHVLGSGTLESDLKYAAAAPELSGKVAFFGRAQEKDIASYLLAVDCVVIPSRFDSIPLVFS